MGLLGYLLMAATRPDELRNLITYKVWRDPVNDIKQHPETSGWDRERMRDCRKFLDLTSRSFAAVIKELKGELSRVICLFYLILRALDTIEDDMTIPADKKIPLLVNFYKYLEQDGWNFKESGPNEKDRQLLVEFDKVIGEYKSLDAGYKTVISDITAKMGAGMASYIELGAKAPLSVTKWTEFDLYCHFVAGLVGEGLSRLFSESKIERPWVGLQLELSNHMGLFLQKTNIIRDYAEDCAEGRFFWPKECWGDDVARFGSQDQVASGVVETSAGSNNWKFDNTEAGKRSKYVLSSMLLDAMCHATSALDYLSLLKDQSVFNFCAIPQVMAIATLHLMFNNANVLKKNVKIRKGQAVGLIIKAINPRDVSYVFLDHTRKIHKELDSSDPNFLRWAVELARIEQWCETYYPSFVSLAAEGKPTDARSAALKKWADDRKTAAVLLKVHKMQGGDKSLTDPRAILAASRNVAHPRDMMSEEQKRANDKKEASEMMKFFILIIVAMTLFMVLVAAITWEIVWYFTMDGPDPLLLKASELYNLAKAEGLNTVAEIAHTVRVSIAHVWKNGISGNTKVEL